MASSTLFSMTFSAMLIDVFQDSDTVFPIRYRFDSNIFNLRRLQAKTKVQIDVLDVLDLLDLSFIFICYYCSWCCAV